MMLAAMNMHFEGCITRCSRPSGWSTPTSWEAGSAPVSATRGIPSSSTDGWPVPERVTSRRTGPALAALRQVMQRGARAPRCSPGFSEKAVYVEVDVYVHVARNQSSWTST